MRIPYPSNEFQSNKYRILLVDDDPDIVEVLVRGLKVKGLQVHAYTSPQEALQSFEPGAYDLAILDIRMPSMTGFQLYREMKTKDKRVAVYFLSAVEIQPDEFRSVFPSMDGVKNIIKKPLSINELLNQITPFLRMSARARGGPGQGILINNTFSKLPENQVSYRLKRRENFNQTRRKIEQRHMCTVSN